MGNMFFFKRNKRDIVVGYFLFDNKTGQEKGPVLLSAPQDLF